MSIFLCSNKYTKPDSIYMPLNWYNTKYQPHIVLVQVTCPLVLFYLLDYLGRCQQSMLKNRTNTLFMRNLLWDTYVKIVWSLCICDSCCICHNVTSETSLEEVIHRRRGREIQISSDSPQLFSSIDCGLLPDEELCCFNSDVQVYMIRSQCMYFARHHKLFQNYIKLIQFTSIIIICNL